MEAKELRIGNWVDNGVGQNYIIDTSWFMDILNFAQVNGKTDLKPIPLTEEWLIKFGFEISKDPEKVFYEKVFDIYHVQIKRLIGRDVFYLELNKPNGASYLVRQVQNVHQLQNLYFVLTGEELTIKE